MPQKYIKCGTGICLPGIEVRTIGCVRRTGIEVHRGRKTL